MSSKQTTEQIHKALIIARHNVVLIRQWAGELDHKALSTDFMRCYAILYAFIVIAEAIKDVPKTLLERYAPPKLWRIVSSFRNYLAHTYEDLPDDRVIATIHTDLPNLKSILEKMIADLEATKA